MFYYIRNTLRSSMVSCSLCSLAFLLKRTSQSAQRIVLLDLHQRWSLDPALQDLIRCVINSNRRKLTL